MRVLQASAVLALSMGLIAATPTGAEDAKAPKPKPPAKAVAAPAVPTPATPPAKGPDPDTPARIVRTETLTFDNWTVNCAYTDRAGARPRCSALLRDVETIDHVPRIVFTWLVGQQQARPVLVMSMQAGVLIGPGVTVKIGDAPARTYAYSLCAPDHCEATVDLDPAVMAEISRATTALATITRIGGQSVTYALAVKGFDQALAALGKQ